MGVVSAYFVPVSVVFVRFVRTLLFVVVGRLVLLSVHKSQFILKLGIWVDSEFGLF